MEEAKKDNLRLDDDTLENVSGGKNVLDLINDKGDHEMGSSVVNFDCPVNKPLGDGVPSPMIHLKVRYFAFSLVISDHIIII
ncbi:MAG: hypothetical protein K6A90_13970 [Lachnospiraceae bacterium]|nr:hypothetical protein [Lachnospiraceae bacterium]